MLSRSPASGLAETVIGASVAASEVPSALACACAPCQANASARAALSGCRSNRMFPSL
ncbi:Uncharacterised protein [Bordetella pertussis]|nr:Uncharacterised protein [Bordetella pertussis]CFW12669.1 Uncharacterised protein [Bordetella pertussis]CFW41977.1 Uncharacterised protein [Bordetella pertussis]